jgi:hypothetical protein
MSDTEIIGNYVTENLPELRLKILEKQKPSLIQILKLTSELLEIPTDKIREHSREQTTIDARTIFILNAIQMYCPEKLNGCANRPKIISEIAILLNKKSSHNIYEAIKNHKRWIQFNSKYRDKFNYVQKIINGTHVI